MAAMPSRPWPPPAPRDGRDVDAAGTPMTAPHPGDRQHARDLQGIPLRGILIGAVLALVLNELVCNSLTHGLQQRQRGMVVVDANERNGTVELCVADDGEGLPEGFSLERNAGLGLSIIQRLVQEQLGGGFRLENAAAVGHPTKTGTGTCALVSFPFDG